MRAGVPLSLVLHGAMLAGGLIYLPQAARQFSSGVVVPVDLVTLADTTNVRAAAPEPVVEEETPPAPEPEADDPADDNIVPEPVTAEAPPPEEDTVEIIDDGLPDEAVEPEIQPDAETPPPTPRERPDLPRQETPPRQQEQAAVDLDYLSGLVDQARESQPRNSGSAEVGARRDGAGAGTAMTATLADLIYSQARPCYRSSADAPNPERLVVDVRMRLNRDGSLAEPPVSTNSGRIRASGDPFWLVAEERALAAVIECSPFRLPPAQYSEWRLIEVTFSNNY